MKGRVTVEEGMSIEALAKEIDLSEGNYFVFNWEGEIYLVEEGFIERGRKLLGEKKRFDFTRGLIHDHHLERIPSGDYKVTRKRISYLLRRAA